MSTIDDYESILAEADVQFGDSPIIHDVAHDPHRIPHHDGAHDKLSGQGQHQHPDEMLQDEQDDTPFVIMAEHGVSSQPDDPATLLVNQIGTSADHPGATFAGGMLSPGAPSPVAMAGTSKDTWTDKKDRQKAQNRKAAEKSRQKKRGEQMAMEVRVAEMQEENARLRARLSTLLAARSPRATSPVALAEPIIDPFISHAMVPSATNQTVSGSGIDYAYISKLQTELTNVKSTLLDRTLELARVKGQPVAVSEEVDHLRREILGSTGKLVGVQAEESSLRTLLQHLRAETQSLIQQRERVAQELRRQRSGQSASPAVAAEQQEQGTVAVEDQSHGYATESRHDSEIGAIEEEHSRPSIPDQPEGQEDEAMGIEHDSTGGRGGHEDKALLDIGGWIDAAVKDWDQGLPPHKGGTDLVQELEQAQAERDDRG
ncbi:hypothetical protein IAU60_000513 [Kwoniella sp. DSM 27419]